MAARLGGDLRWDSEADEPLAEQVLDLRTRLKLGADVKLSERVRLVLEGRLFVQGGARRDLARPKAFSEVMLGEAFVDFYSPAVDVRVGNQVVAFGANPVFAPADVLNPRDFRDGLLLAEPEDARLPAPAVRATGALLGFTWTGVVFPFFVPHRYAVFGQDEALLQPPLGRFAPGGLHPSIEDALQPHVLETERPYAGDLGLRVTREVGGATVGLSWVWMNEKFPQVGWDPEVRALMDTWARGEVPDPNAVRTVQGRAAAGEPLFSGRYDRQHVLSVDGSVLLGTAQLDLDLAYSPRQTFLDERLVPISKPAWTWVLGVSHAEDAPLLYSVTYVGLAVPGVGQDERLVPFEPGTALGQERTAWLHLIVADLRHRWFDDRLEIGVRAVFEALQRSFAVAPKIRYQVRDGVHAWAGAEMYEGPPLSPFGYYGRNDQVLVGIEAALF